MPRRREAATTEIRIAPFRSVVIDGRARGTDEVVRVPKDEAETLLAEGYAVSPDAPPLEAPGEPVDDGRRGITPSMVMDEPELEERG